MSCSWSFSLICRISAITLSLKAEQKSAITLIQKISRLLHPTPCMQPPNKSHDAKCAGRAVHDVKIEPKIKQLAQWQFWQHQLHIDEGKILGAVAKFTTKQDMQRVAAAAIWEVSNHIKASIWWDGIVCLWSPVLHFHCYAFRFYHQQQQHSEMW